MVKDASYYNLDCPQKWVSLCKILTAGNYRTNKDLDPVPRHARKWQGIWPLIIRFNSGINALTGA